MTDYRTPGCAIQFVNRQYRTCHRCGAAEKTTYRGPKYTCSQCRPLAKAERREKAKRHDQAL